MMTCCYIIFTEVSRPDRCFIAQRMTLAKVHIPVPSVSGTMHDSVSYCTAPCSNRPIQAPAVSFCRVTYRQPGLQTACRILPPRLNVQFCMPVWVMKDNFRAVPGNSTSGLSAVFVQRIPCGYFHPAPPMPGCLFCQFDQAGGPQMK